MAKSKTYAVKVTVTTEVLLFVDARGEGAARAKLATEQGWREATRYNEDAPYWYDPKTMVIGEARAM